MTDTYNSIYCKVQQVTERTNYILDIFSTEYTQQAFTYASRSFTVCVQRLWTILHNDDNEREQNAWSRDDVIKWKHCPRYWPFVRGIHRGPVNSLHKGQWRRALMFSLICVWINDWVNNREAGDLRRYIVHYDVTVMAEHGLVAIILLTS